MEWQMKVKEGDILLLDWIEDLKQILGWSKTFCEAFTVICKCVTIQFFLVKLQNKSWESFFLLYDMMVLILWKIPNQVQA